MNGWYRMAPRSFTVGFLRFPKGGWAISFGWYAYMRGVSL